jgi:superfamily II DNA/RNA helicase
LPDFADLGLAAPLLGALATEGYTEDYVYRIGRTARAGAPGVAIAFCSDMEHSYLREIEKLTRVSIRAIPVPSAVSVGAAANRPPETTLPRSGQSLSKQTPRPRPNRRHTVAAADLRSQRAPSESGRRRFDTGIPAAAPTGDACINQAPLRRPGPFLCRSVWRCSPAASNEEPDIAILNGVEDR